MTTEPASSSGPRLGRPLPYGRTTCGYQAGFDDALCDQPATWHLISDNGHTMEACDGHLGVASPLASDRHAFGAVCGIPGTIWQVSDGKGEGFCFWPAVEEAMRMELAVKEGVA